MPVYVNMMMCMCRICFSWALPWPRLASVKRVLAIYIWSTVAPVQVLESALFPLVSVYSLPLLGHLHWDITACNQNMMMCLWREVVVSDPLMSRGLDHSKRHLVKTKTCSGWLSEDVSFGDRSVCHFNHVHSSRMQNYRRDTSALTHIWAWDKRQGLKFYLEIFAPNDSLQMLQFLTIWSLVLCM